MTERTLFFCEPEGDRVLDDILLHEVCSSSASSSENRILHLLKCIKLICIALYLCNMILTSLPVFDSQIEKVSRVTHASSGMRRQVPWRASYLYPLSW